MEATGSERLGTRTRTWTRARPAWRREERKMIDPDGRMIFDTYYIDGICRVARTWLAGLPNEFFFEKVRFR